MSVHEQKFGVYPIICQRNSVSSLGLGYFIGMVNGTGVQVKRLSKKFSAHGRALNVPAREPFSPRRAPMHCVLLKATDSFKPKGKICRILFLRICNYFVPRALFFILKLLSSQ